MLYYYVKQCFKNNMHLHKKKNTVTKAYLSAKHTNNIIDISRVKLLITCNNILQAKNGTFCSIDPNKVSHF